MLGRGGLRRLGGGLFFVGVRLHADGAHDKREVVVEQVAACARLFEVCLLSGCHGAFGSPLRGLRLPNRPGLPGVFSALMRQVRAPTSWRCPSKRALALTSCLDRLPEGVSSVRRYLRHERMGVFRPSLWFHRSPTGHSPREPRISRAFASAARATAQEVVALAGLASIHPKWKWL